MSAQGRTLQAQIDRAAELCGRRGARLTRIRREVLGLILEGKGPLTAYQILDLLRPMRAGAVPPTVYRALEFLLEHRLIHRIEKLNAYVACIDADHQHPAQFLICQQCGSVSEIEDRTAANALRTAAEREGFHPDHAIVEIEGTCSACYGTAA